MSPYPALHSHSRRIVPNFDSMPLIVKSDAEIQSGLDQLTPELASILEEKDVRRDIRGTLGACGMKRYQTFANYASTEEALRVRLRRDLGITDEDAMDLQIQVSGLIEAWRTARNRVQFQETAQEEARAAGRVRDLTIPEGRTLRDAHEAAYRRLEDYEYPSRDYLGWRFSQFETGTFLAEELNQVVSFARAGDERADPPLDLQFTPGASKVMAVRRVVTSTTPKDPEQLREAYALMKVHWQVVRLRFPDRRIFLDYHDGVWDELVNFLLGPRVWQYRSEKNYGISWGDMLTYAYEIRKEAMRNASARGQVPLARALTEAMENGRLENRYFTLPLATSAEKKGANSAAAGSSNDGGGGQDAGRKRELDQELAEVKRLKKQLQDTVRDFKRAAKGGGKGGGGKGMMALPAQQPLALRDDDRRPANEGKKRFEQMAKREKFIYRVEGTDKVICKFFQWGSCRFSEADCRFAHLCLRCHHPGHGCIDAACKARPKPK